MKSFLKMFILFGLLGLSEGAAVAKDNGGHITGNVADILGEPLRNALIHVVQTVEDGENFTVLRSDARGFFKTALLDSGIYYLQISHQGYRPIVTTQFVVDDSRSVSLEIALQKFADAFSSDDPRNQGFRQVLRGVSDRRLIFRSAPGAMSESMDSADNFTRGGAMNVASGSAQSEGYLLRPQASQNGVSSNFAFTEPLSSRSRVILSGQIDTGAGSFWRLRNTYNYRPDSDHDYSISVGYGRMAGNQPVSDSITFSRYFLPADGLETFAFSTEGATRLFDLLSVRYGVDYTRLHYGEDKSYFYPSVQILLTPSAGWSLGTSFTSRRFSDASSITLPDGETLNLAEPTLIALVGDQVSMSQVRHSEAVVRRELNPMTSLEFAVYRDNINGSGIPLLVTAVTPSAQRSCVIEVNKDNSSQKGMRLTAKHSFLEHLTGSVVYIYGESREISLISGTSENMDALATTAEVAGNPEAFMRQGYRHSMTGRIDAFVPMSGTNIIATVRWNSGNPLTALDWFADKMDIDTNSANLEVRQILPLPAFLDVSGRWEVMVELRNALNQGRKKLATADGEIAFDRNPRSVRFGLNYTFH